jgi:hypothetical protein
MSANPWLKRGLLTCGAVVCVVAGMLAQAKVNPTDPQPTCEMCPGTYIPLSELDAYTKKAIADRLTDQQVRDIDIGKAHVGIGMVYRTKLDKPQDDHINYLMVRIDPDKVTPLRSEAQSMAYLTKAAPLR